MKRRLPSIARALGHPLLGGKTFGKGRGWEIFF